MSERRTDLAASSQELVTQSTAREPIYPHSGVCAYCERERDDLFWHAQERKFYCADIARCEARAVIKGTGAYAA